MPDRYARSKDMAPAIEVRDLVKRYRKGSSNAVDGVSFDVEQGQFFALLGPNGAGKTTTISILTTTLGLTSGTVRIAGHDVVREASAVRREVGIIFQNPSLHMNLSGEENIRFHAVLYRLYPYRPLYRLMSRAYRRTRRTQKETSGHQGACNRVREDTKGNAGIREDTTYGRFGTVRTRVQIPRPRPFLYSKSAIYESVWS